MNLAGVWLLPPGPCLTAPDVIAPCLRLEPFSAPGVADIVAAARQMMARHA